MRQGKWRKRAGWALMVVGVALGGAAAGPLSWGLGCLLAAGLFVGGWHLRTDPPTCLYDESDDDNWIVIR